MLSRLAMLRLRRFVSPKPLLPCEHTDNSVCLYSCLASQIHLTSKSVTYVEVGYTLWGYKVNVSKADRWEALKELLGWQPSGSCCRGWQLSGSCLPTVRGKTCDLLKGSHQLEFKKSFKLEVTAPLMKAYTDQCSANVQLLCKCHGKLVVGGMHGIIGCMYIYINMIQKQQILIGNCYVCYEVLINDCRLHYGLFKHKLTSLRSYGGLASSTYTFISINVESRGKKIPLSSHGHANRVTLMLEAIHDKGDHLLGYPKLSLRDGQVHLHVLHDVDDEDNEDDQVDEDDEDDEDDVDDTDSDEDNNKMDCTEEVDEEFSFIIIIFEKRSFLL
ncbi:unnamed protein product, partial [Meganyctiphanes norvegica]